MCFYNQDKWAKSLQFCLTLCDRMGWSPPTGVGCHFLLQGIFLIQGSNPHLMSPALAGSFFIASTTREAPINDKSLWNIIEYCSIHTLKVVLCRIWWQISHFIDSLGLNSISWILYILMAKISIILWHKQLNDLPLQLYTVFSVGGRLSMGTFFFPCEVV